MLMVYFYLLDCRSDDYFNFTCRAPFVALQTGNSLTNRRYWCIMC